MMEKNLFFAPKTRDGKKDWRVLSRIRHSENTF